MLLFRSGSMSIMASLSTKSLRNYTVSSAPSIALFFWPSKFFLWRLFNSSKPNYLRPLYSLCFRPPSNFFMKSCPKTWFKSERSVGFYGSSPSLGEAAALSGLYLAHACLIRCFSSTYPWLSNSYPRKSWGFKKSAADIKFPFYLSLLIIFLRRLPISSSSRFL